MSDRTTQTYVAAGPLQFALDDARRARRSFWREGPALFRHWTLCFAPHWVSTPGSAVVLASLVVARADCRLHRPRGTRGGSRRHRPCVPMSSVQGHRLRRVTVTSTRASHVVPSLPGDGTGISTRFQASKAAIFLDWHHPVR